MRFLTLVLAMATSVASASGTDTKVFETFGEWTIMIRSGDPVACYATRMGEDGSEVQIGVEPDLQGGYFAVYNSAWTHIKEGDVGSVEFNFGTSRFGGEAVGKTENDIPGGYAFFDNPAFVEEFANRQTVKVIGTSGAVFEMDLTGTKKAVTGVLACQDAQPKTDTNE
ncbi:hypothetical protein C1J03_14515 [Sulfitobacter sp. SK012]|uniref:hypothetical protein n=1 Tax=Sulfitobacter sp. SK012 TaxID=1389005 RepID=UPI000E0C53C7|nr:hypothetical protein [Sulfitobacter sp. SK012]AXI47121.1 hypothetical protein C1J03_14515 [Sulfitobacter sp. SK012]